MTGLLMFAAAIPFLFVFVAVLNVDHGKRGGL